LIEISKNDVIRYSEKENLMTNHQEHYGKKFYQDKDKGYWISTCCPKIRAHRWVWIQNHGKIPKGYHVHHRDENKSNNSIENLELIESSRHLSIHITEEKREWARKWAAEIRPLTKEWHASEEGKAWHKFHAIKNKFGKWEPRKYICDQCSTEFESTKRSRTRFCSNPCKSKWRRDQGLDDVIKVCVGCGTDFTSNKYAKNIYCSRGCRHIKKLP
jgi:DNA-directed RNA polymerase subunit RPC12/RpoP